MITASEPIPYGSPITASGHIATLSTMIGIARRPHQSNNDRHYEVGETVMVRTDGHIIAEIDRKTVSVVLKDGRVFG